MITSFIFFQSSLAQTCTCEFLASGGTAGTPLVWGNAATWTKNDLVAGPTDGCAGKGALPGAEDCVRITGFVNLLSGVIYVKGVTLDGGNLTVDGVTTRLYIGPGDSSVPGNISLSLDDNGQMTITNSALVSVQGNWWNKNNGNIITSGASQGYFEVTNCVSVGQNGKRPGDNPANSCTLNTNSNLGGGLIYCIRCTNSGCNTAGVQYESTNGCRLINILLPIELVHFHATYIETNQEPAVLLKWATAQELNNDYFTVERSADGKTFEAIQQIPGAGTSKSLLEYAYTDQEPVNGISYYRLRQTDTDGSITYSKIVSVSITTDLAQRIVLYPNPNDGKSVKIKNLRVEDLKSIALYDAIGRLQIQSDLQLLVCTTGMVEWQIEKQLPKGVYLLQIVFSNGQCNRQKLVLH